MYGKEGRESIVCSVDKSGNDQSARVVFFVITT